MHSLGCRSGSLTHPDPSLQPQPQFTSPALSKVSQPSDGSPCTTLRAFEMLSGRASSHQGHRAAPEGGVPNPECNSTPTPTGVCKRGGEGGWGGGARVCDPGHDPVCKCIRWAVVHDPRHTPIPVGDPICDLVCKCIHWAVVQDPQYPPDFESVASTRT